MKALSEDIIRIPYRAEEQEVERPRRHSAGAPSISTNRMPKVAQDLVPVVCCLLCIVCCLLFVVCCL